MEYISSSNEYELTRVDGSKYRWDDLFPGIVQNFWSNNPDEWDLEKKITWDELAPSLQELIIRKIRFSDLHKVLQDRIIQDEANIQRNYNMIVTETTDRKAADKILQDQIKSLADRMTSAEKRIKDLESRMDEAERQIKLLWEKLSETEARVSALESKLYREVEPALSELQDKVRDVEDQIETIKGDIETIKTKIKKMPSHITGRADSANTPDGSAPNEPREAQISIIDVQTADAKENTTLTYTSQVNVCAYPDEEFWTYVNVLPANYGDVSSGHTLSLEGINVSNATILDTQYGNEGNPNGIPLGYARVKLKGNPSGDQITITTNGSVSITGFNADEWEEESHSISDILNRINFAGNQPKLFPDAGAYISWTNRP